MQKFLTTPKYNKNYIYINPTTLHQQFTNAYAYHCMVKTGNPTYKKSDLCVESTKIWKEIKKNSEEEIKDQIKTYLATPIPLHLQGFIQSRSSYIPQSPDTQPSNSTRRDMIVIEEEVPKNAAAQKKALANKREMTTKLLNLQESYKITKDPELKHDILQRIVSTEKVIADKTKKIKTLKRNAAYQAKSAAKKLKLLHENQEIVKYDSPGRPSILHTYPDLHEHIHDCIEFGKAHEKRRREVIKVRTVHHLRSALEEKYNEYLARTTLNTYLLP